MDGKLNVRESAARREPDHGLSPNIWHYRRIEVGGETRISDSSG